VAKAVVYGVARGVDVTDPCKTESSITFCITFSSPGYLVEGSAVVNSKHCCLMKWIVEEMDGI